MIESPMSSPTRQYVVVTTEGPLRFKLPESLPVNNVTSAIRYVDKYIPSEVQMEMCVPYENEATHERFKNLDLTEWINGKPTIVTQIEFEMLNVDTSTSQKDFEERIYLEVDKELDGEMGFELDLPDEDDFDY